MDVELRFGDGPAIEARYKGHVVHTDQPVAKGGRGAAPSPFDLFVVSLATCAGFYVSTFLRQRGLPTEDLGLRLTPVTDGSGLLTRAEIEIQLPAGVPEKYRAAVVRAAEQCLVKRQLERPPEFEVSTGETPLMAVSEAGAGAQ
jgi:ribosomal protein S12 methylthiotransferase accessory factor